jgi:subtilisin family serine protease
MSMRPFARGRARYVSAMLSSLIATTGVAEAWAQEIDWTERAIGVAAQDAGTSTAGFDVLGSATILSGAVREFKVMNGSGQVQRVLLDARGRRMSETAVDDLAARARTARFSGTFDPTLVREMLGARSGAKMRVLAWMDGIETPTPERSSDAFAYRQSLARIDAAVQAGQQPFVEMMQAGNARLLYRAEHVPITAWEVSVSDLRRMAPRAQGVRFYPERVRIPRLSVSRVVVQANTVNARGFSGQGRRLGIVEPLRVGNHPNLPAAQRVVCGRTTTTLVDGHKTNVAGVMQSNNATNRGMAPLATLVEGVGNSFADAEMMLATDCVIDNNADAVNMSFGFETNGVFDAFARYVDRKVFVTGKLIVPAVSNFCANRMGSPEIAFNALAVGGFGDRNTTGFGDDLAACTGGLTFNAFTDPLSPSNDREEPDVVAPGASITTTNSAGGFSSPSGTSFAAPHVTALVTLLTQRDPQITFQAERSRAVVMASARHNIEGATRLSERDGAGAILMAAADAIMIDGLSSFFSTPGGTQGFPINRTFTASAGQRVRVAISWAHKSPEGDGLTRPTTDLDLDVTGPAGTSVASSRSFDNNYEIVDFTAPATGTYTAQIQNFRSSAGAEFIGFAASRADQ